MAETGNGESGIPYVQHGNIVALGHSIRIEPKFQDSRRSAAFLPHSRRDPLESCADSSREFVMTG